MKDSARRVIAIGLDGFEYSIADAMMRAGRLPMLKRLAAEATIFQLDHGDARETDLAWEHFSTGRDPDSYERWSAVEFDPTTYVAAQKPTRATSFLTTVDRPVAAFDVPYLDLASAPAVRGMANWGAHDPGVARHSNPISLAGEVEDRFGPYPAGKYIYGFVWPSAEKAADMADRLIEAVRQRTEITRWLIGERLPDWQLAVTVVAELHSAAEALWHGWDTTHPLHAHPSAAEARRGLEGVYEETDRLIRLLHEDHPDAGLVVFSMHGMGPNTSDLLSMALLPELMYRRSFGRAYLHPRKDWALPCPSLGPGENWSRAVIDQLGRVDPGMPRSGVTSTFARTANKVMSRLSSGSGRRPLQWMPAAHYAPFWPRMDAFALPAFYDGQIRVNLQGRERNGRVAPEAYDGLLDELETVVRSAVDPVSRRALVKKVERPLRGNPFAKSETRCDMKILWAQNAYAMQVQGVGLIGPVPQRRTGGHTGDFGYAAILGAHPPLRNVRVASSFDVVPTILSLIGVESAERFAGRSLVA